MHIAAHLRGVGYPISGGKLLCATDYVDVTQTRESVRITPKTYQSGAGERRSFEWEFIYEAARFFQDVRRVMNSEGGEDLYRDRAAWWGIKNLSRYRYQVDIKGYEHLEPNQPYIFAPTHASELDYSLLSYLLHPFDPGFVMKFELGAYVLIGPALRSVPWNFFVDRFNHDQAMAELNKAISRLNASDLQESLVIFPHGEFPGPPLESADDDGDLFYRQGKFQGRLKAGVGYLAVHSGLPVVPIITNGAARVFRYGSRLQRYSTLSARKNADIEVIVDKPILTEDQPGSSAERIKYVLEQIEDSYRRHYRAALSPKL